MHKVSCLYLQIIVHEPTIITPRFSVIKFTPLKTGVTENTKKKHVIINRPDLDLFNV